MAGIIDPITGGAVAPSVLGSRGTFSLVESDPPRGQAALSFTAYLLKAPIVVAGYGGWSRVPRPRKKAMTEWVGRDSVSVQIEFLIDTLDDNTVGMGAFVESQCRDLESIGGVESNDPEPPLCIMSSVPDGLMPHGVARASHVRWFLDTLTWDADNTLYNSVGNRVRAAGTLTMTQYVADSRLEGLSAVARRQNQRRSGRSGRSGAKRKTYTVKAGDTLSSIAARRDVYNNAHLWRRIAKANHIRDPKRIRVGQKLRIP